MRTNDSSKAVPAIVADEESTPNVVLNFEPAFLAALHHEKVPASTTEGGKHDARTSSSTHPSPSHQCGHRCGYPERV